MGYLRYYQAVSTHSRLKAAGLGHLFADNFADVSTHSRLKAAGGTTQATARRWRVSTHSRLKAAGPYIDTGIYD